MAGNEERVVIEAARPSLANMTQAIVKPDIIGNFELKQYMRRTLKFNAVTLRNRKDLEKVPKKRKDKPIPEVELIPKETHESKKNDATLEPVEATKDVLREIPKYAMYIKDIVAHKRRLTEFETVALTEECTSRVQNKLPQNLKDLGSFTIPAQIGNIDVGRALCDLGESINMMPLSLFKQLGLGALRPTTVMLQLADRSIAHP
uniref:Uncharacterized protein LOC104228307 n=1 Tax=Nicotiana sylvestris TaxID=4096 RepID=A0A1U7WXT7_NICSY|nr:PREDICTED: uncharacterized protein LOC104228307 [Nicotiana sylvestris]